VSSPSSEQLSAANPNTEIMQLAIGYMPSACLYIAAKLRIADLLAVGSQPVGELARASQVNEDPLYRILRALASVGVFCEVSPRRFANTPLAETLLSDVPGSSRDTVLFLSDPLHLRVFAELMHPLLTLETAFRKTTGMEPFEFFRQNEAENKAFNAAMTAISATSVPQAVEVYDFGNAGTLADIGGGHGMLLALILEKHGGLRGIVYDLPNVIEGASKRIESLGLASRCEIQGGDFFESVPPADSYVLKSIIHDWDDARAVTILENCARSMRNRNGRVILIEQLIEPGNKPSLAKWIDMEMLAMAGGRERTQAEYADLFRKAGLRLTRVVLTPSPFCVIESVKA